MVLQTRVKPEIIWQMWEKAHAFHSETPLVSDNKGTSGGERKGIKYQIVDVVPGKSFSVLWKSLFVRLIFTHSVEPKGGGSEIRYDFTIKGLFAGPVRWVLGKKIQAHLDCALKSLVKECERGRR